MKNNKGLKVNRGEDMDSLYESMEYDFENGADIIDSLRRINKVLVLVLKRIGRSIGSIW